MPTKNRLLTAATWSILCLAALFGAAAGPALWAAEPTKILLWPRGAPDAKGDTPNDKPTLTVWLPPAERANGAAVVICPGGGYNMLATGHEGRDIAAWLNSLGVAGFMLEYRHWGRGYHHPAPLEDAQRAIRTLRARADEWKIAVDRIGIMGFSAGGHLASTAGTHFDPGKPADGDPVERAGCRPDFLILCYGVLTLGEPFTNRGTQDSLLGANPPAELVRSLSNEKQVTPQTPPTFLFQTDEDTVVPAENSVLFYLALRRAGVPAELHVFRTGAHGLGLAAKTPGTSLWPKCCEAWLRGNGLLDPRVPTVTPRPHYNDAGWMQRHQAMNDRVKKGNVDLLFIGDSITHFWETPAPQGGAAVWKKYYARRNAVDLGIAGDGTGQVLWRLRNGNVDGIAPKLAVLMIGTNNAWRSTPEDIAAGVKADVAELRTRLPQTKVLVLAIFPRGADNNDGLRKVNDAANKLIAKLADGRMVFFQDINARFLDRDGKLPTAIMPDLLHPCEKGYQIWAEAIEPTVAKLLGDGG
jgi:acetyl esterase/lipase/lysophospholipase L1-like esterase